MRVFRLIAVACLLSLSGCAVWTKVEQPLQTADDGRYAVEAPLGWVRLSLDTNRIVLTRDGLAIQTITVERPAHDKAFPESKQVPTAKTLPNELADMVLAELRAQPLLGNVQVKANTPRMVAGKPGFALHIQYRNDRGASFDRLIYGTAVEDGVLLMSYNALRSHYFERDKATFEKVVSSYRALKSS